MADIIRTTKNKLYKYIRSLQTKKSRTENHCFTVEGIKSVRDAMNAGCKIQLLALSEALYASNIFNDFKTLDICIIDDKLFGGLCDTKTPQGVLAVIEQNSYEAFSCDPHGLYVYCDNISDPGNLGTIIRTADAAGIDGVLLSPDCTDLYSPKTVRASMGSFFHTTAVPSFSHDRLLRLAENGFTIYSGALRSDSTNYKDCNYLTPTVIVVGNEANGVSADILEISKHIIIPIYGKAESLNAAIAAALMMYEATEQRRCCNG